MTYRYRNGDEEARTVRLVWEPAPAPGGPSSPGAGGYEGDSLDGGGGGGGGGTNNASTGGGGGGAWSPIKKLAKHGWDFYWGSQSWWLKNPATNPLAGVFYIPKLDLEGRLARLVGADPNSKSYFAGSVAPDIALAVFNIGAVTRAALRITARTGLPASRIAIPKPRVKVNPPGAASGNGGTAARGGSAAAPRAGSSAGAGSKGGKPAAREPVGKGCSFLASTAVLLSNGTSKAIDQIKVGDKVLATDPETGKTTPRPVIDTIVGADTKTLVQLTVDATERSKAANTEKKPKSGILIATDNHPFWVVNKKQWLDAGQLKPGMWLRTSTGTHVQITAIKSWTKYAQVYNLTVQTDHTYYVLAGNTPVLVHNCDRVQFAHGTSRASSANIRANGLSKSDGLANLNGSQHPGSFFTSRLDPIDGNPAVGNAASWGARAARSAGDDGVSVVVFSLPKSIVRQLEEAGHLTDHPAIFESVSHPDGFALFNKHVEWDDAFEIPFG
ncbi:polymorphic toxin-type HINT domain-containing protein [Spirillospora sp. NPDC048911]|uniref:polymorphic toxin-type HINT domain-containing protein n=1 Tax=Spirillospora sp. NPDC048911 TaxID=3364527 RepID=UPI00371E5F6A